MGHRHRWWGWATLVGILAVAASTSCTGASPPAGDGTHPSASSTAAASPPGIGGSPVDSRVPVVVGEPIDVSTLTGRIVLSADDDIYTANADGTGLMRVTRRPGPEFDPAWSPDRSRIVYRDSRRGINHDDDTSR